MLEHLPATAAIQADDIIAMNGSPDRHRGVRSIPVSGADSISSSEAMKNGRRIRASNARPAMSRCGRRRRQRCALMKAKQRVPALRGGRPDDLASNGGGCDRNFVAARLDEMDNHAQQPRESEECRFIAHLSG